MDNYHGIITLVSLLLFDVRLSIVDQVLEHLELLRVHLGLFAVAERVGVLLKVLEDVLEQGADLLEVFRLFTLTTDDVGIDGVTLLRCNLDFSTSCGIVPLGGDQYFCGSK